MIPLLLAGLAAVVFMKGKNKAAPVVTSKTTEKEVMILPDGTPKYLADLPRGIRNNNPLNIKVSSSNWLGKLPIDENTDTNRTFEQFKEPEYGIRAAARILNTYRTRYGLDTIEGIIKRFAPDSENHTVSYIDYVSKQTGISKGDRLRAEQYPIVLGAMIKMENGMNPYDHDFIVKASAMA